jgi:hypothetical protein
MDSRGALEGLLSCAGVTVASAALLIIAFSISGATRAPDAAIALQSAASAVCGDIGTVAVSAVPYNHSNVYDEDGIALSISSDFVIARSAGGAVFAKPLPVRVYPGRYSDGGSVAWSDTAGIREYLNATFGCRGTPESPLAGENATAVRGILEAARKQMALAPVAIGSGEPVTIEKLPVCFINETSDVEGCDHYVFVYRR